VFSSVLETNKIVVLIFDKSLHNLGNFIEDFFG
jgi:hypothetical protein